MSCAIRKNTTGTTMAKRYHHKEARGKKLALRKEPTPEKPLKINTVKKAAKKGPKKLISCCTGSTNKFQPNCSFKTRGSSMVQEIKKDNKK